MPVYNGDELHTLPPADNEANRGKKKEMRMTEKLRSTSQARIWRRKRSRAEWIARATELYGEDPNSWRFKCPHCGGVQTRQDFLDVGMGEPDDVFFFSCIGRYTEGRGCDWTLGGLFQIHTSEVTADNGDDVPVFEFEDEVPLMPEQYARAG